MEKVNEAIKDQTKDDSNFLSFVFNFNEENKAGMLNMMQYTLLAILPVVIILKVIRHYVPEEDDSKPSIEILAEVVFQLFVIFLAIWFVDKMIRFIPTYSGICYYKFNETNFIIPILILLVTMQTKLGAKINILLDRIMELWQGKPREEVSKQKAKVKVSQPIVGGGHQPSQADTLNNNGFLPPPAQSQPRAQTTMIADLPQMNQDQYMNVQNELIDPNPLMAANEALGGVFGCSF